MQSMFDIAYNPNDGRDYTILNIGTGAHSAADTPTPISHANYDITIS